MADTAALPPGPDAPPRAVARALRLIALHPSVRAVESAHSAETGLTTATVRIDANLPARWRVRGWADNGVRAEEAVTFVFSATYPLREPYVHLREDFDRSHPHLQPRGPAHPPEPCLLLGSVRELLRSRGIVGFVEQVADWIERAALVRLNDPSRGWEVTRRDEIDDLAILDTAWVRALPGRDAGCDGYIAVYAAVSAADRPESYRLIVSTHRHGLTDGDCRWRSKANSETERCGDALALIAWSGRAPSGGPFVAGEYLPESVVDVASLHARATVLGCGEQLRAKLGLLQSRLRDKGSDVPHPVLVILLARRPYDVAGANSPIEICPYLIEVRGKDDLGPASGKPVRLVAPLEQVSADLMRLASGEEAGAGPASWTLLGCGSVGSKIATHMARSGRGPSVLIDRGGMRPHNYARHALFPTSRAEQLQSADKAPLLGKSLVEFKGAIGTATTDIVARLADPATAADAFQSDAAFVVNATGSLAVREALCLQHVMATRPRVVETCLLGAGRIACMAVEGPGANPSLGDIAAEAYRALSADIATSTIVFGPDAAARQIAIGQGCSSLTFPMTDAHLSAMTAPMATVLGKLHAGGLPMAGGELLIGLGAEDGLGQSWTRAAIEPWTVVREASAGEPGIRVSPRVDAEIAREVAARPGSETGGIILGRYSDVTDSFHVVDTLPAPPDSRFSPEEFVLGVEGLPERLQDLVERSGGSLYPLGTWHNHLVTSGPSHKDMATALRLAVEQAFPLLMLIHTPGGYRFLVVEATAGPSGSTPSREAA
ncbi:ThiF family protein [Methylobacterium sp. 174MFSha1.1]|uniref:ThiF family adenylyltransferase n=1 Tax=Methylobacterium sp. 174MFSha1.1 TaxID=1502749 RepID=UPI0008F08DC4|nr:ThiF family adenylyltransferase [Methylobacterium sp. 174MFSha1.1]SFU93278.1 ThiF family protein [Methylobacterium sp. 174MFSha1.1]